MSFQRSQGTVFFIKQYYQRKSITVSVFYILYKNALVFWPILPQELCIISIITRDQLNLFVWLGQEHSSALLLSRLESINHRVTCSIVTETAIGSPINNCTWLLQSYKYMTLWSPQVSQDPGNLTWLHSITVSSLGKQEWNVYHGKGHNAAIWLDCLMVLGCLFDFFFF